MSTASTTDRTLRDWLQLAVDWNEQQPTNSFAGPDVRFAHDLTSIHTTAAKPPVPNPVLPETTPLAPRSSIPATPDVDPPTVSHSTPPRESPRSSETGATQNKAGPIVRSAPDHQRHPSHPSAIDQALRDLLLPSRRHPSDSPTVPPDVTRFSASHPVANVTDHVPFHPPVDSPTNRFAGLTGFRSPDPLRHASPTIERVDPVRSVPSSPFTPSQINTPDPEAFNLIDELAALRFPDPFEVGDRSQPTQSTADPFHHDPFATIDWRQELTDLARRLTDLEVGQGADN